MNLVHCTPSGWWGAWGWNLLFHRPYGYYKEGPKKGKHINDLLGLHKAYDIGDRARIEELKEQIKYYGVSGIFTYFFKLWHDFISDIMFSIFPSDLIK